PSIQIYTLSLHDALPISEIPDVVRRTLQGETIKRLDIQHDEARLTLPVKRRNRLVEIIPISKGCLGACTFCQTVIARGRLKSFPDRKSTRLNSSHVKISY